MPFPFLPGTAFFGYYDKKEMRKKKDLSPYILVLPAVLIILCVVFFPVLSAIFKSFQSYDLRKPSNIGFIGLKNYIKAFSDEFFLKGVCKTFLWVVFGVGFQFIFGFGLALLLNKKIKGKGVIRALSMVPWVTPGILTGLMWKWMYDANHGVINTVLMKLGVIAGKVPFLAQNSTALPSAIVTIIWQGIPFFALMLLAGLQSIPGELYEAASIDGASKFQRLRYITIPSLKNTILTTGLLRIIWVANSVDVIMSLTEGGPAYATQTLSVYIFGKAKVLNLGFASAMAILMAIMLASVAIPYLKMSFKED